ncbi:MAG: AraC family transcriptional regulator [Alphaproteobacteria bacterium]|nr:AraC family transcriptional regulator [Alphaproteobacteria bacterium]
MTAPLLENYARFHSGDPEATQAYLDTVGFQFEPAINDAALLDMRVNGIYLPGMFIGYTQYGKAATIRATPERTDYWFLLPVHGSLEATVRKDTIDCDPRRGVLTDPSRTGQLVRSETNCGRLNIILTERAVRRQLGALLGTPLPCAPDFAPAIDVMRGYGRSFAGYLRLAIDDFEGEGLMLRNPIAMQQFEQLVLTNLLLSHPHDYSQALRRLAKLVASRDVKRAIDFMEANLAAPIGLAEITAAAGVPGRTLLEHFKRYKGISPMAYLRRARFAQVREALRSGESGERVTDVALSMGFNHMGRFSVEYRRRFGESPSETLRQRRVLPTAIRAPTWSGRLRPLSEAPEVPLPPAPS